MKKKGLIVVIFIGIVALVCIMFLKKKNIGNVMEIPKKINYMDYYHDVVVTRNEKKLYQLNDENFTEVGSVSENSILELNKEESKDKYFKIKDINFYITYEDLEEGSKEELDLSWKNYIPYDESIKTTTTNLYREDSLLYSIEESMTLPIVIKDEDRYGVVYEDKLYYIKKDDGEVIVNKNTELEHTDGFSTLVYHATYDSNNQEEKKKCIRNNATICLSDKVFEEQMKYLKESGFYTATMKDVEYFIDGKVQLPKKTVLITIDDGYFLDAAARVLENYELHATLFLIGALVEVEEWNTDSFHSKALEVHSHSYIMHNPNMCPGGQGSAFKCLDKEILLDDLRKSREQLNGSTVFCYPFFEYNDYAISVLKEAGFTMAFAGGRTKIKVGSNKMTLPRYGIINTTTFDEFKRIVNA